MFCFTLCSSVPSVVSKLLTTEGTELRRGKSHPLRCPQFCAAGPRVAINLFFSGSYWLFCQQPVLPMLHALAYRVFHDAVFQGVKADHHQPSTRFQQLRRCIEQLPQVVQFTVYEYSESLKGPGRRMNPVVLVLTQFHWPGRG